MLGQVVRTFEPNLASGQRKYQFIWDGRNENGVTVTSGNYFFIVSTPQKRYSLKLLLIK